MLYKSFSIINPRLNKLENYVANIVELAISVHFSIEIEIKLCYLKIWILSIIIADDQFSRICYSKCELWTAKTSIIKGSLRSN